MGGQVESPLKKALPQHVSPTKHLKFWGANHIQSFMSFQARVPGSGFWLLLCHVIPTTLSFRKSEPST
jgi:hypothetical protein